MKDDAPFPLVPFGAGSSGETVPAPGAAPGVRPAPSIPDHTVLWRIGKGSYGEVWLARTLMGAYRAVKVVYRDSFDHRRPYEREYEGIRRFEPVSRCHPSQLHILQVGLGAGYFYYVMEAADDQGGGPPSEVATYAPRTLRSEMTGRGRLPVAECLELGAALATALGHLHEQGLVHRDIKPSNIIFVEGIPKLADIGLVASAEATQSFVGTEGYLPPEGPGTPQADLFSLGKVLYEASTGRDRQQFPELPTDLAVPKERAGLAELNQIILRACHPDPRRRHASAAELHAELALVQSGRSVSRMRSIEKRVRVLAWAGATVTVLGILAAAALLVQARVTRRVRELADQSRQHTLRLQVHEGLRRMDAGDMGGAALWFAGALGNMREDPDRQSLHRMRLNTVLALTPRPFAALDFRSLDRSGGPAARFAVDTGSDQLSVLTDDLRHWQSWQLGTDVAVVGRRDATLQDGDSETILSPDGRVQARRSTNGVIRIETLAQPGSCRELSGAFPGTVRMDFSHDGARLAALTDDLTVLRVFESDSGRLLSGPFQLPFRVRAYGFLPGDNRGYCYIAGSGDGMVWVWAGEKTLELLCSLRTSEATAFARVSPDGRLLLTCRGQADPVPGTSIARVWDLASGRPVGGPLAHERSVLRARWAADGRRVVTASADGTARVWNAFTGEAVTPALPHQGFVWDAAFSPDGLQVATACEDGTAVVWDAQTGEQSGAAIVHGSPVTQVEFLQGGAGLATAARDGVVRLWDLARTRSLRRRLPLLGDGDGIQAALSPTGDRLIEASFRKPLRVWEPGSGGAPFTPGWDVAPRMPRGSFSADGSRVAVWDFVESGATEVRIFDLTTRKPCSPPLKVATGPIENVAFNPDGSRLAIASHDPVVRIWDLARGEPAAPPLDHRGWVWRVAWSPRGDRVLTVSSLQARLWDAENGRVVAEVAAAWDDGHSCPVRFTPDGTRFALGARDFTVQLLDAATGKRLWVSAPHGGHVRDLGFSSDGRFLVSASDDQTVRGWDTGTGRSLWPPLKHGARVCQSRFGWQDRVVLSATTAGAVRLWDARTGEPATPWLKGHGSGYEGYNLNDLEAFSVHPRRAEVYAIGDQAFPGLSIWSFPEPGQPVGSLVEEAEWLTGRRLTASVAIQPLEVDTWLERLQRRTHAGDRREKDPWDAEVLAEWHRSFLDREPDNLVGLEAAAFHRQALDDMQLGHPGEGRSRPAWLGWRIPARDPQTPPELIDLSNYYSDPLDLMPGHGFQELPRGLQRLAGTTFDIRGAVMVRHSAKPSEAGAEARVRFIHLGRSCRQLHFLLASDAGGDLPGAEAGRLVFHYADGSAVIQPLRFGEHLWNWWLFAGEHPNQAQASAATVAWEGRCPLATEQGATIRLFKYTWPNPQPGVQLSHLDLEIGETPPRPFIVAITAE